MPTETSSPPSLTAELRRILQATEPLGDRLLVELLPITISKVLAPPTVEYQHGAAISRKHWDHKTREAVVLAAGPKCEVRPGVVVVFAGDRGKWICHDDFRALHETEILGVKLAED